MTILRKTKPFSTGIFVFICCATVISLTTAARAANIIAFGDSITAGNISRTSGYAPKLTNLLNSNNKPSLVANYGSWGEKTTGGVNRIDSVLAAFPSQLILIMEGTNDIRSGISVETTRFNLQTMINKAKAAGTTPVLSTLTPSDQGASPTLIPQSWNPMIRALAGSNGIKLADNYAATAANWGNLNSDGIHPNDSGHQIIANTWYATIASMISSTGAVDGGGGGGGGSDSPCFIATAAFGSPVERHVMLLKEFRDAVLLKSQLGRQFVSTYYQLSPPIAQFIAGHDSLRSAVRICLYPLIAFSYCMLKLSWAMQCLLLTAGLGVLALSALAIRHNRRSAAGTVS